MSINPFTNYKNFIYSETNAIISTNVGHSRSWLKTDRSPSWIEAVEPISTNFDFSKNFNQFLLEANLYRKIF